MHCIFDSCKIDRPYGCLWKICLMIPESNYILKLREENLKVFLKVVIFSGYFAYSRNTKPKDLLTVISIA